MLKIIPNKKNIGAEILVDLNKDEKKLFLMKERMTEHSDKDTFLKIEELVEKIIMEMN